MSEQVGRYESDVIQAAREYREASAAFDAADEEQRTAERKATEAVLASNVARHRMKHAQAHLLLAASGSTHHCGFSQCDLR